MEILDPTGLRLPIIAGDIASPVDGDTWYNSATGKFRCKENGVVKDDVPTLTGSINLGQIWVNTNNQNLI